MPLTSAVIVAIVKNRVDGCCVLKRIVGPESVGFRGTRTPRLGAWALLLLLAALGGGGAPAGRLLGSGTRWRGCGMRCRLREQGNSDVRHVAPVMGADSGGRLTGGAGQIACDMVGQS